MKCNACHPKPWGIVRVDSKGCCLECGVEVHGRPKTRRKPLLEVIRDEAIKGKVFGHFC